MSPLVVPGRRQTQGAKPRGTRRSEAPGSEPRAAGRGGCRGTGSGTGGRRQRCSLPRWAWTALTLGASSSRWVSRSLQLLSLRVLTTTSRQRRARGGTKSSHRPTSCQASVV